MVLIVGVAAVGVGLAAHVHAASAADAAALAAAPVTFAPFGADGSAANEAARYAALNGTVLVRCACATDRSWRTRTVTVEVTRRIRILGFGLVAIRASSRATFEPAALIPTG